MSTLIYTLGRSEPSGLSDEYIGYRAAARIKVLICEGVEKVLVKARLCYALRLVQIVDEIRKHITDIPVFAYSEDVGYEVPVRPNDSFYQCSTCGAIIPAWEAKNRIQYEYSYHVRTGIKLCMCADCNTARCIKCSW